jgi:hypothetical protein
MEFLIDAWEWIRGGRELGAAGMVFVVGILYVIIVRRRLFCDPPEQK